MTVPPGTQLVSEMQAGRPNEASQLMNPKGLIRNPMTVRTHKAFVATKRKRSNAKILKQIESARSPVVRQIWKVLTSLQNASELPRSDQDWIDRIELERNRLLARHELVNDGSLGEPLLDQGDTIEGVCRASKPPRHALLLFLLARALSPDNVIELGTNVGISSAYIGAGLRSKGHAGRIVTLDLSVYRQRLAKEVHRNLDIDNISSVPGWFVDTLPSALHNLRSVDLAFIDGYHLFQSTLHYFDQILKYSPENTVFVFDDIRWSDGMSEAWTRIQSDERLGLVIDLSKMGICAFRQRDDSLRIVSDPIYVL